MASAAFWHFFGSLLALVRQLSDSCRPALVPIQAVSRALRGDCSCPPPSFLFLFTLQRYEIIFNLPNIYAIIFCVFFLKSTQKEPSLLCKCFYPIVDRKNRAFFLCSFSLAILVGRRCRYIYRRLRQPTTILSRSEGQCTVVGDLNHAVDLRETAVLQPHSSVGFLASRS